MPVWKYEVTTKQIFAEGDLSIIWVIQVVHNYIEKHPSSTKTARIIVWGIKTSTYIAAKWVLALNSWTVYHVKHSVNQ